MELNNLELNKEYKNKNEVCKLLGIEKAKGGRNIKYQDIEIARYIKLEKSTGHKLIVTEIYTEIKDKIDNRGKSEGSRNNNSIYTENSSTLLLEHLNKLRKQKNSIILYATTKQLAHGIGLINNNYATATYDKEKFRNFMFNKNRFANYMARKDVFDVLYSIVKPVIVNALEKLQKDKYIKYTQGYLIYFKHITGNKSIDVRKSNTEENRIIKNIQVKVLKELGIEDAKSLRNNNKLQDKYYKKVEELVKEKIEMQYFVTGFEITMLIERIKDDTNIKEIKKILNDIIFERATIKIRKKINISKDLMKGFSKIKLNRWDKERTDCTYLFESEEILRSLVKLDYQDISNLIKETPLRKYKKHIVEKGIDFSELSQAEIKNIYDSAQDQATKDGISWYIDDNANLPF